MRTCRKSVGKKPEYRYLIRPRNPEHTYCYIYNFQSLLEFPFKISHISEKRCSHKPVLCEKSECNPHKTQFSGFLLLHFRSQVTRFTNVSTFLKAAALSTSSVAVWSPASTIFELFQSALQVGAHKKSGHKYRNFT